MDLVFASDNGFVEPLATALRSVQFAQPINDDLIVWVLNFGINNRNIELLSRSFPDVELRFCRVDPDLTRNLPSLSHFGKSTYGRLFMGDLLPESVTRVLYLDADIIVRRSLSDLLTLEMDGLAVAACRDQHLPVAFNGLWDSEGLGIPPNTPYFNTGVMMVDLDVWRRSRLREKAVDVLLRYPSEIRFADQDALNIVLRGEFKELRPCFNQQAPLRTKSHLCWAFLDASSVAEAVVDPFVVHYTGQSKPWSTSADLPLYAEWREIRRTLQLFPEFHLKSQSWSAHWKVNWRILSRKIRRFVAS